MGLADRFTCCIFSDSIDLMDPRQWPVPWRYGVLDDERNEKPPGVRSSLEPEKKRTAVRQKSSRDLMRCFFWGREIVEIFFWQFSNMDLIGFIGEIEFSGRSLMFPPNKNLGELV